MSVEKQLPDGTWVPSEPYPMFEWWPLRMLRKLKREPVVEPEVHICIARKQDLRELTTYMETLSLIDQSVELVSFFYDPSRAHLQESPGWYVCIYIVRQS